MPDFVCLSVCQQDNSKSYGQIFLKFSGNVGNGKNYQCLNFSPGFWITLKFSLTLLSMGHMGLGNRCQTEYGAVTWRTTWPWRRCASSDCFLVFVLVFFVLALRYNETNSDWRHRSSLKV